MRKVGVLGAPSSAGADSPGLERGPAHLRACGVNRKIIERGARLNDYGDCPGQLHKPDELRAGAFNLDAVAAAARQVRDNAALIAARGEFILLLGGDRTVTIGLLAALGRSTKRLGLLYLHNRTDLHTPDTSETGTLNGMGLAHMIGLARNPLSELGESFPLLNAEKVVVFGYQPERIDEAEHKALAAHSICCFPATEVTGRVAVKAAEARALIERACDGFVIHFDIAPVNFKEFPAADLPTYCGHGLSFQETLEAFRLICASEKCLGVSITEFNPDRDPSKELGRRFVASFAEGLVPAAKSSLA